MRPLDYILLLALTAAGLFYLFKKKRKPPPRRRRRSSTQLTRREQNALQLLQVRGFKLAEIHPSVPVSVSIEQKSKDFVYEGDFIVSKKNKTYLVKVKRGDTAPLSAALRQELILEQLLFQTDGLFLYDSEKEKLQELKLSFNSAGSGENRGEGGHGILWQAALFMLVVAGLALLYRLVF